MFKKSNERDSNSHLTPKLYTVNRPTNILAEPKGYNFVRSPRTFGWNQVWRQIDDFTYKTNKIVGLILVQNLFTLLFYLIETLKKWALSSFAFQSF